MLSKEEIKHILDANVDILTYKADKDFRCLTSTEKVLLENNEKIKEYISQLESDNYEQNNIINSYIEERQKLIEKLEEDSKQLEHDILTMSIDTGNKYSLKLIHQAEGMKKQNDRILEILKKE